MEEIKRKLTELRNKMYDNLPIGEVESWELIEVIGSHIKELDTLIDSIQSTRWVPLDKAELTVGEEVLVRLDYSKWGRGVRVEKAYVHHSDTPIAYGGPNSLTGRGFLTGWYFSIPAIVAPGVVTHIIKLTDL